MKTQLYGYQQSEAVESFVDYFPSPRSEDKNLWRDKIANNSRFQDSFHPHTIASLAIRHFEGVDDSDVFHRKNQRSHYPTLMSSEVSVVLTADPMIGILESFYSIPEDYYIDLFKDFRDAAASQDLRRLLDTISDWAATAELYAYPSLAADFQEAIGGRKGVADWLHG